MWHIAKRELYDNLNSLRFALATVLLLGLMLTNAIVHLREHPERVKQYQKGVSKHQSGLYSHVENSLYDLAQEGPGNLYKKISDLRFCAEGGEAFLSEYSRRRIQPLEHRHVKKLLDISVSISNTESEECSASRHQSRLGFYNRLCLESCRTAVYFRCDFRRTRAWKRSD